MEKTPHVEGKGARREVRPSENVERGASSLLQLMILYLVLLLIAVLVSC